MLLTYDWIVFQSAARLPGSAEGCEAHKPLGTLD